MTIIKLKELRTAKNYSQEKLATLLEVSRSTVAMWEIGASQPDHETLVRIADVFDVSIDYLLGHTPDKTSPNGSRRLEGVRIPVYGEVAAGIPILAIENYDSDDPDDWEEIPEDMARNGEYIALRIKGDSMEPKISKGDVVIVRLQPDIESGETAIVCVNGDTATCKKVKKTPQGIILVSTNPDYEPMFYTKKEVVDLPVTIIGKVVELRAKF